jgi:hypothetical protein
MSGPVEGEEFAGAWLGTEVGRQVRPVVRARRRLGGRLRVWVRSVRDRWRQLR